MTHIYAIYGDNSLCGKCPEEHGPLVSMYGSLTNRYYEPYCERCLALAPFILLNHTDLGDAKKLDY